MCGLRRSAFSSSSNSRPSAAGSSWSQSGSLGQHSRPSTPSSGRYSPAARSQLRLLDQLDLVHAVRRPPALVATQAQTGDRVEEPEADAAGAQDLVHGREHRVAHARLHLVHDRSAVAEGEPQQVARRGARGDVGRRDRASRVAERDVVDGAQHRRALLGGAADRDLLGAVPSEPGGPLLVVDHVEAVLEHAVLDDARERRDAGVDGGEEEAQARLVVAGAADRDPEPVAETLQETHEQSRLDGLLR